jgi:hypothetical protein
MKFTGNQKVTGKVSNNNILGVTLTINRNFAGVESTLFSGILLPGGSKTYDDHIFGNPPLTYHHLAETSSDAAFVNFRYDTGLQ